MFLFLLLVATVIILTFVFFIGWYNERYWRKRGVIFDKGNNHIIGPYWQFLTGDRALFEIFGEMYKKYHDEPAVGFSTLFTPSLFILDPKNVQYVMQGSMFIDRGIDYHKEDYLADNILFMSGVRWKLMRQKMTPLFTSIKLKNMYYIIDKSTKDFVQYLHKNPEKQRGNTFDTLSTFCCSAIGDAVFGVSYASTFVTPFLDITRKAFSASHWNNLIFTMSNFTPALFKVLQLKFFKQFEIFFIAAMKQVFRQREKEGVKRHDFPDICLSLQRNGVMKHEETGFQIQPTDELLAAQGFFFFIAGVEPTATSIFGAMIEIGRHPEIQKRLQEEIDRVFEKYNGQLTYEAIIDNEYLDKVIKESLRMYPPLGFVTRRCTEPTILPVGNIKVDKGTKLYIPIYAYHHDPKYFVEPYVFNPERFDDSKKNFGVIYQPFGFGNRICIGMRYARLQVKSGLAHILRNFDLKTVVGSGGIKFGKDRIQLRVHNVDVIYTPKKVKST
uniref:unspecific monooxygenase n=1 Tax=Chilo suppressalis TaxID=168631 RepID=X5DQQ8_CHISP|nr:CYP321F2 [Chilo suppressalis]